MAVLVSSFEGVGFKNLETASVSVLQSGQKIDEILLGAIRSDTNSTVLAAMIYKKDG
jgi:stress response protein SCP2